MTYLRAALNEMSLPLITELSGGGSDANSFQAQGKSAVNLSIGYDKIHTTEECLSITELEKAVLLVLNLAKSVINEGGRK